LSITELIYPECPKCNRILKPSEHNLLACRYCKISVKNSFLRRQKDPLKSLEQYKKIPEGFEINNKVEERLRLKEDHEENMSKYKHSPVPKKCIECKSEDIVASDSDNAWECLSCEAFFSWYSYRVIYHGDIEVEAGSEEDASEKAYYYMEKGIADIETDVDRM